MNARWPDATRTLEGLWTPTIGVAALPIYDKSAADDMSSEQKRLLKVVVERW